MATKKRWFITEEMARADALKCKTRSEFGNRFSGSWRHLSKKKLLESACSHMQGYTIWTDKKVLTYARTCGTRDKFKRNTGAYGYAVANDLILQCHSHMGSHKKVGRKPKFKFDPILLRTLSIKQVYCEHDYVLTNGNSFGKYYKCSKCEKKKTKRTKMAA